MFQRFTSALFGADTSETKTQGSQSEEVQGSQSEEVQGSHFEGAQGSQSEEAQGTQPEEAEEDWILLNYQTDWGSADPEEEDMVMVPRPTSPPHCPSLTTDPENQEENPDSEVGFLRVDMSSLEESWFVTPPACFTRAQPRPLEPSPLENLLIEHPSMSVYLLHTKPRPHLQRGGGAKATAGVKKEKRRPAESRLRPEGIPRRPSCVCVPVSVRTDPLQPRPPLALSRNALRRLNPQRPLKAATPQLHQLHQPAQRQCNF